MGGILLIQHLVDVVYTEHDLHLQKLGNAHDCGVWCVV